MLKRRPGPEAARVAAKRGHSVVLVERQERVGGQLNLRAALPDREIFGITPEWYERQLRQLNVDVRLNTEATADLIMAEEPGAIQDGHRFARTVGEPNAPRTFADLYFAPVDFSTFRRPGSVLLAPSGYRLGTNDLDCGAACAHLDPAWRAGRHPAIRLRRWAYIFSGIAAVLLVFTLGISFLAWREEQGNTGPPLPLSGGIFGVALSPDGRTVATISANLEMWDVADRANPWRLAYTKGDIAIGADPAFSPDGRVLATAGGGGGILWNVADPARPAKIVDLPGPGGVGAVQFSPDGRILASSYGGTVALWNIADPAHPARTATLHAPVPPPATVNFCPNAALAFSADGHTLTMVEDSITVTQWNVTGPGAVARLTTSTLSSIGAGPVAFSADGRTLAGARTTGDTVALSALP